MNLARSENAQKKLREAEHFLNLMRGQEGLMQVDSEIFDYNLSAFLNAARCVDYKLRNKHGAVYATWRKTWDATNPAEADTLKFFADDRNLEVHEGGSGRGIGWEEIVMRAGTSHSDASGTTRAVGPPGSQISVFRNTYSFTIGGVERNATEACAEYLTLLNRLVSDFGAGRR